MKIIPIKVLLDLTVESIDQNLNIKVSTVNAGQDNSNEKSCRLPVV